MAAKRKLRIAPKGPILELNTVRVHVTTMPKSGIPLPAKPRSLYPEFANVKHIVGRLTPTNVPLLCLVTDVHDAT